MCGIGLRSLSLIYRLLIIAKFSFFHFDPFFALSSHLSDLLWKTPNSYLLLYHVVKAMIKTKNTQKSDKVIKSLGSGEGKGKDNKKEGKVRGKRRERGGEGGMFV